MKENLKLIILPLYRCNQNCPYCIFGQFKENQNTLNLSWLEEVLSTLDKKYNLYSISIEGGEVSLLSDFYFDLLFRLLKIYTKKLTITTNFINYNKSLINNADVIEVGYNFNKYTEQSDKILHNIKAATSSGKIINIKSLDISVQNNPIDIISELNKLKIKAWKIIPYQKTEYTNIPVTQYSFFENTIMKYLKLEHIMEFSFLNKLEIDGIIKNNNYNIPVVYLTPNNMFGIGKYDTKNQFYIQEVNNLFELENLLKKQELEKILICRDCKYKVDCLSDRYFNPNNNTITSCCGFKNLLNKK